MIDPQLPDEAVAGDANDNRSIATANSNNNVHFDGISRLQAIVLAVIAGLGLGFGVFAEVSAVRAERESRMLEYYLLELDAKFIAAGLKNPDDAIAKKLEDDK